VIPHDTIPSSDTEASRSVLDRRLGELFLYENSHSKIQNSHSLNSEIKE
jgi:hypothetical protein